MRAREPDDAHDASALDSALSSSGRRPSLALFAGLLALLAILALAAEWHAAAHEHGLPIALLSPPSSSPAPAERSLSLKEWTLQLSEQSADPPPQPIATANCTAAATTAVS